MASQADVLKSLNWSPEKQDAFFNKLKTEDQKQVLKQQGWSDEKIGAFYTKLDPYGAGATPKEEPAGWKQKVAPYIEPTMEALGAATGAALALPANIIAPGVAEVAGAGMGYLAGKEGARGIKGMLGVGDPGDPLKQPVREVAREAVETVKSVPEAAVQGMAGPLIGGTAQAGATTAVAEKGLVGMAAEAVAKSKAGQAVGKSIVGQAVGKAGSAVGKFAQQILGKSTGSGSGMTEAAVKNGPAFTNAMRGKTTGQDIVDSAKTALSSLKEQRGEAYRSELAEIAKNKAPQDMTPIKDKVQEWLKRYKVAMGQDGKLDFSNSPLPKEAATKVEEAFTDIMRWDKTPGNNTALGLDTLKQRLDNYYSDSSAARAVIANLRDMTKKLIMKDVPQYEKMTKGYQEATMLIKDIEAGLMLRKQGMTGRIVGDQTLRRLTSSMMQNNSMRLDLVKILGEKGGKDLAGQIAGYSASSWVPHGLAGSLSPFEAIAVYLKPDLWPVLAASSPRLVGEFLRAYGKGLVEAKMMPQAAYRTAMFGINKAINHPGGVKGPAIDIKAMMPKEEAPKEAAKPVPSFAELTASAAAPEADKAPAPEKPAEKAEPLHDPHARQKGETLKQWSDRLYKLTEQPAANPGSVIKGAHGSY